MNKYKHQKSIKDIYQEVTDFVLKSLNDGDVIWKKQWNSLGLPRNIINGHVYRGWNLFLLNYITMSRGYRTPYFLTFKQASERGGSILKGEKGISIIYWAVIEGREKLNETNDEIERNTYLIPKTHVVFNVDQTIGIDFQMPAINQTEVNKIETCEVIVSNMPAKPSISHAGDKAFYHRLTDKVTIPQPNLFHNMEAYYSTLFHELAHSTGHESRLNRKELNSVSGFGDENYSKEELTAEFTAAFLCAIAGIEQQTIDNSAAYINGWLKALRNDNTLVMKASIQAQAAADYILSTTSKVEITDQKTVQLNIEDQS